MNLGMNVIVLDVNAGAWKLETERGVIMDGDKRFPYVLAYFRNDSTSFSKELPPLLYSKELSGRVGSRLLLSRASDFERFLRLFWSFYLLMMFFRCV